MIRELNIIIDTILYYFMICFCGSFKYSYLKCNGKNEKQFLKLFIIYYYTFISN